MQTYHGRVTAAICGSILLAILAFGQTAPEPHAGNSGGVSSPAFVLLPVDTAVREPTRRASYLAIGAVGLFGLSYDPSVNFTGSIGVALPAGFYLSERLEAGPHHKRWPDKTLDDGRRISSYTDLEYHFDNGLLLAGGVQWGRHKDSRRNETVVRLRPGVGYQRLDWAGMPLVDVRLIGVIPASDSHGLYGGELRVAGHYSFPGSFVFVGGHWGGDLVKSRIFNSGYQAHFSFYSSAGVVVGINLSAIRGE